jgi:hypothetical protein
LSKDEGVDFITTPINHRSSYLIEQQPVAGTSNGFKQENGNNDGIMEFPLLLAREDGIIYATELSLSYSKT